jgi:hypothetical protein
MVVRAGDQRGAARSAVEQADLQMIAAEIDGSGEPRRAAADYDAIVLRAPALGVRDRFRIAV